MDGLALSSLAELRLAQQCPAQALPLAERSLRIHEQMYAAAHPTVVASRALVARAVEAQQGTAGD